MDALDRLAALGDTLGTAGAIVGGCAALFGAAAFLVGSLSRDLGYPVDPLEAAEEWAQYGAAFGFFLILFTLLGVNSP